MNIRNELSNICKITDEEECKKRLKDFSSISIQHSEIPLNEFNCFEYAFGIFECSDYMELKKKLAENFYGSVFCNSWFVKWLLKKNYIKKCQESRTDYLILYDNLGDLRHAAVSNAKVISSKWGTGCIYKHDIFDIPNEYGKMYKQYELLKTEKIFLFFKEYLKNLRTLIK